MNAHQSIGGAAYVPPGPGTWLLDNVHMSRPFSRFQAEIHPPNLMIGFSEGTRRFGMLVDTLNYKFINGFGFFQPVPVPDEQVPERFAAAEQALASRLWRTELDTWSHSAKPTTIRAQLALQAVDPSTLDRTALLDHLHTAREHLAAMIRQHHRFNAAAMVTMGDFIAQVSAWTGLPLGEFMALIRGSAPESAGACPELDQLVEAIRQSAPARALLVAAMEPGEILSRLSAESGAVGEAARVYLEMVGYRLVDSLDVGDAYALEMPEVMVKCIRLAADSGAPHSSRASASEEARVLSHVPEAHRAEFGALLEEARCMSRLRDERGLFSDVWAAGLMRRAILAAGERLVAEGRIGAAAHLVEADWGEMQALTTGSGGPSAEELAARVQFRATAKVNSAPPFLGPPPEPPHSTDGLPPAAGRTRLGTRLAE